MSVYVRSGQEIGRPPAGANWMQYQAVFVSPAAVGQAEESQN